MKLFIEPEINKDLKNKLDLATRCTLEKEGLSDEKISVSVSFVDSDMIKKLNKEYRGIEDVTDVLSFPQFDSVDKIISEQEEVMLGDVVMCNEQIAKQAKELEHSEEREILYLYVHSILHLLSYDHDNDDNKRTMRGKEKEILYLMNL